jgi:hypothetical protein
MDATVAAVLMLGLPTVGKPTVEALYAAIGRILGPSADAIGDGIAAPLRAWAAMRANRAGATLMQAAQLLTDAGVEPQPVPGRILMPILEHASMEEDPELQRKWSALLANAATAGEIGKVLPAFADILRVLTPVHARILDWMRGQEVKPDVPGWFSTWPDFERATIEKTFALSAADYALFVSDLERLRLIEPHREINAKAAAIDAGMAIDWVVRQLNDRERYKTIALTAMGVRFMQACTPPTATTGTP